MGAENLALTEIRSPDVQRVASHYIDCPTLAHIRSRVYSK